MTEIQLWEGGNLESVECAGFCGRLMYPARRKRPPYRAAYHVGRGLCNRCHATVWRDRALSHYDLSSRPACRRGRFPSDDFLDEYRFLRDCGIPIREVPSRLGMKPKAVERQLLRARTVGDPRAADYRGMAA